MRKKNFSLECLTKMLYFDRNLVLGELSVNHDAKHLVKRLRTNFIQEKRSLKLIKTTIGRFNLEELLSKHQLKNSLLNPKDRQNVPLAVQLLQLIREKTKDEITELSLLKLDIYKGNTKQRGPLSVIYINFQ